MWSRLYGLGQGNCYRGTLTEVQGQSEKGESPACLRHWTGPKGREAKKKHPKFWGTPDSRALRSKRRCSLGDDREKGRGIDNNTGRRELLQTKTFVLVCKLSLKHKLKEG